jgi:hypothetical protein
VLFLRNRVWKMWESVGMKKVGSEKKNLTPSTYSTHPLTPHHHIPTHPHTHSYTHTHTHTHKHARAAPLSLLSHV